MTLRKSDLYGSLWKSCDELRGGMDASQYKDYVLTLLFMKYVSDKAAVQTNEGSPDASYPTRLLGPTASLLADIHRQMR